ncbi:MAG TPA: sulfatase [Thermoanaerobaculia bacterium]|jgi:arylsulfatase A-like enzyme|nr:sulfatase [Thermoanaerobaculia bacterium]
MMSRSWFRSCVPLACLFGLLAGCGRTAPPRPGGTVRDLIADLDLAEIQREPGRVDLGTSEARPLLRQGWSQDEDDGRHTFVWSDGPESELEFFLAAPRDIPLTLRGSPYSSPGSPEQEVALVLNGEAVGRVSLSPDHEEARVVLPRRGLREGENHLTLRYAWTRSPWEESGGEYGGENGGENSDRRHLGVAWDLLRFETGVDEQSRVRAAGDRLALPFGRRLDTFLRLPAGAVLAMDDLRSRGGPSGELRVTLQPEGGAERELARLRPDEGPVAVELGDAGTEPARISLTAVSREPGEAAGSGLVLRRPAIAAPRPETGPSRTAATAATAAKTAPASFQTARRPRNVIVYLVDALRADHLGCYGYARPVSPRIDNFARGAVLFRHTVAQSSWTRPAATTILTGLLPRTHGVNGRRDVLAGQAVTLAERLRERGYHTAGLVTNGNVARSYGLGQGFETYQLLPRKHSAATDVNAEAADWLRTRWKGDAPFFLYLHTVEPHAPYAPPLPFRQRFAPGVRDEGLIRMNFLHRVEEGKIAATPEVLRNFMDLYDAEIAANDAAFGELLDLLGQRGLLEDTVIVFVSDHGEEFLEHGGWEHGRTLHQEMLDVPLIVRVPGMGSGRIVQRQAQQMDVAPTILDLLNLPVPPDMDGRSLARWISGDGPPGDDPAESMAFSWLDQHGLRAAAVTTPGWRLIEDRLPVPGRALYDRQADPGEHRNLAAKQAVRAGYLRARLRAEERLRQRQLRAGKTNPDSELQKQLEALGYLR